MARPLLTENSPARNLFPQYNTIYDLIAAEVQGLTDTQLDWESDRWEWSKWSIRRNLSHMASVLFRWLAARWGDQLFPNGAPVKDLEGVAKSSYDRRLDEIKYWKLPDILMQLKEGLELCHLVMSRETVGSVREKTIRTEKRKGEWRRFHRMAHPTGVTDDPSDPNYEFTSLECTLRHMYYELVTHLYNIQRLKKAQGLKPVVQVPKEGYWTLPGWDVSEPS